MRYRAHGRKSKSVTADTVSNAVQAVGKGISNLGYPDPRLQPHSDKLHPLLADLFKSLKNEDDPAGRAYPVNIYILQQLPHVLETENPHYGLAENHVCQLCILAFFFLLRPCEYVSGSGDTRSKPFRLCDISFSIGSCVYPALTAPLNEERDIDRFTGVSLTFSDQKNGVKGELIGLGTSGDPDICPVRAAAKIVLHLRQNGAEATLPIYYNRNPINKKWHKVSARMITKALRVAAQRVQHQTGIIPDLVSCRSLRPGGATALLCADIDTDKIMLLGRWRSDAMFRYLRAQAATKTLAQQMFTHGSYTFHPQAFQACDVPRETPTAVRTLLAPAELYD